MAAFYYTVHTSSIFTCLYLPNVTLKTFLKWRADTFSASKVDCTPHDSLLRSAKHQTGASRLFSIGKLVSRAVTGDLVSYLNDS